MDQKSGDGRFSGCIFKSSRSIAGKDFPNFELLDARFASSLNKIIQNSNFKKKVSLEEQKAQRIGCFEEDRSLTWFPTTFESLVLMIPFLIMLILFSITLRNDNVQDFDTRWDEILLSMTKIPTDDVLESLYKLRIRECDQLKTVLELYDKKFHQKISMPNYQKMKTMVKRNIDQKLRLRNSDARNDKIETGAVVTSRRGQSGVWKRTSLLSMESKRAVFERRQV